MLTTYASLDTLLVNDTLIWHDTVCFSFGLYALTLVGCAPHFLPDNGIENA